MQGTMIKGAGQKKKIVGHFWGLKLIHSADGTGIYENRREGKL